MRKDLSAANFGDDSKKEDKMTGEEFLAKIKKISPTAIPCWSWNGEWQYWCGVEISDQAIILIKWVDGIYGIPTKLQDLVPQLEKIITSETGKYPVMTYDEGERYEVGVGEVGHSGEREELQLF
jgi:hypothetical protein